MKSLLAGLFRPRQRSEPLNVVRLSAPQRPPLIYAIGDIHGCLEALLALEAQIIDDAHGVEGEKWLVYLGDYIDRGPQSAQVVEHLLGPPPDGFKRICLRGNHEATLLAALEDPVALQDWLTFGGDATLLSYGLDADRVDSLRYGGRASSRLQLVRAYIPDEHIRFFGELASILIVPGYIFVHAGLRPGIAVAEQDAEDMIWIRDEFLDIAHDYGAVVVHGHTIAAEPELLSYRIGLDTGCFATGRLTALKIDAAGQLSVLTTS
jgi:serine/threonine protein phosphatase 1